MKEDINCSLRKTVSALNALDLALESQRLEGETRDFVAALLPLLDGVEKVCRGIDSQPPEVIQAKAEAIAILAELADQAAGSIGLERIDQIGAVADPGRFEVVETLLMPDRTHGTVVEVIQPGWLFEGRVLRPARVVASLSGVKAGGGKGSDSPGGETK
jgi:molecular chaperone GrpE